MENKVIKQYRELSGVVVSTKMSKTAVVRVDTIKIHKIYKKRYVVSRKYKAHDENNAYRVGDKVIIRQAKPMSKDKKWAIIKKIK